MPEERNLYLKLSWQVDNKKECIEKENDARIKNEKIRVS
jgi:hypothetical protein